MSQKITRKVSSTVEEKEKDKRSTESPIAETKKKITSQTEKEKQTPQKGSEKVADKAEKKVDKSDKSDSKHKESDKNNIKDKKIDNNETQAGKSKAQVEKPKEDKGETSGKPSTEQNNTETKVNENGKAHNGVSDVTLSANGVADELMVSSGSDDDEVALVIDDDNHDDELFPELTYDDNSDPECFESPTPDSAASRSFTRRSQVKATKTPETPRPTSDKRPEKENGADESKEPADKSQKPQKEDASGINRKLRSTDSPKPTETKKPESLKKVEEDASTSDRKLRSADSPKPTDLMKSENAKKSDEILESPKKQETSKEKQESPKKPLEKQESPKKPQEKQESPKKPQEKQSPEKKESKGCKEKQDNESVEDKKESVAENGDHTEIDIEAMEKEETLDEPRKTDTNYSKSRVKVSPYRRSMRLADQTTTSIMANYTGNNSTMEMDITETSSFITEEPSTEDNSYLSGLRGIRGRRSYKPLKEMSLRNITAMRRPVTNAPEQPFRPMAPVVGRKRKPESEETAESNDTSVDELFFSRSKRMRLLDRIAHPFRRSLASTPLPRRAPEANKRFVTEMSQRATEGWLTCIEYDGNPADNSVGVRRPPHIGYSRTVAIVGINTDLPLTAPVATPETFDPESIKSSSTPEVTVSTPATNVTTEKTDKRCIVM